MIVKCQRAAVMLGFGVNVIQCQFSVPQIEYQLGRSIKKSSHVYFLLQVFWVILLLDINVVLMLPWCPDVTIVIILVPWQLSTGSKHDYLFCYCPLVGILLQVLRIGRSLKLPSRQRAREHKST